MTLPLELPEIETIRRDLDREIAGKKIKAVEVSSMSVIEGSKNKKAFNAELVGNKLGLVERKGLHIFTELDKKKILFIKNNISYSKHNFHISAYREKLYVVFQDNIILEISMHQNLSL